MASCKLLDINLSTIMVSFLLQVAALSVALFRALNLPTRYSLYQKSEKNIFIDICFQIPSFFQINILASLNSNAFTNIGYVCLRKCFYGSRIELFDI